MGRGLLPGEPAQAVVIPFMVYGVDAYVIDDESLD